MKNKYPKISVGIPVRNGGCQIKDAIVSILNQTEQNIEIIISDNCSDDGTSKYLKKLSQNNKNITYFLQNPILTAFDNFMFVLSKARGKYFLWAAHDDTRSKDYIKKLSYFLDKNPGTILAFSDVYKVTPYDKKGTKIDFKFDTNGLSMFEKANLISQLQCFYFYGVWRASDLKNIKKYYCTWWADLPILLAASSLGNFSYVEGPRFNYFETIKTNEERVKYQDSSENFNLPKSVFELFVITFKTCCKTSGLIFGLYATILVLKKQIYQFPGFIIRKLKKKYLNVSKHN